MRILKPQFCFVKQIKMERQSSGPSRALLSLFPSRDKKEHMIKRNPKEDRQTCSKPEMEEQDKSKTLSRTGMEKVYRD